MEFERSSSTSSAIEVLDRVLDKGVVIDASVRVALVGIELIGVDARVVMASFETYLRHADAIAGTGLAAPPQVGTPAPGLPAAPLRLETAEAAPAPPAAPIGVERTDAAPSSQQVIADRPADAAS